jgi:hypothetical protein
MPTAAAITTATAEDLAPQRSYTGSSVKYFVAILSAAVLLAAIAFVGGGYLNTRRAERKAEDRHAAVHSMTQQELAAAIERCDASEDTAAGEARASAVRVKRDAAFCEDVARELDDRPLEIVSPRRAPVERTDSATPR